MLWRDSRVLMTFFCCIFFFLFTLSWFFLPWLFWSRTTLRVCSEIVKSNYTKARGFLEPHRKRCGDVCRLDGADWNCIVLKTQSKVERFHLSCKQWNRIDLGTVTLFGTKLAGLQRVNIVNLERSAVLALIIYPCLTRTGNYQICEFDWLKSNKWKKQKLDAKKVNKNEQTLAKFRSVHRHEIKTPARNEFAR